MGDFVCLLTDRDHKGPHNRECPLYARPALPVTEQRGTEGTLSAEEREALAKVLATYGVPEMGDVLARRVLASDWLAAHDRAIRAEAAVQALRDAANVVEQGPNFGSGAVAAGLRGRADAIAQGGEGTT